MDVSTFLHQDFVNQPQVFLSQILKMQVEAKVMAGAAQDLDGFLGALERLEGAIAFLTAHKCVFLPGHWKNQNRVF